MSENWEELTGQAVELAERWIVATHADQTRGEQSTSRALADLVADPAGLELALHFVDQVARPEDATVAARELARLGGGAAFLSPIDRTLLGLGARTAKLAPALVVPLARARLRALVGHLVVDVRDPHLANHLRKARADGFRLNINLLGEAVLGEREAASRAERTRALLARADVDYVSIKVSSLVSQISTWDTAGTVARVVERLRPIYQTAMAKTPHSFVNLDMEEYRDLDLTIEVFEALLGTEEFASLEAGIVLQAYLPDTPAALERLIEFAKRRVAAGGAPIKVRLVKGANLAMEAVDAELHGWALAPYDNKPDVDANYLRLVERALRPDCDGVLRVGVASHNLYAVAFAHLLAKSRGCEERMDVEMLQGMAPAQARAVRDVVGTVLLYTPVVAPQDFDVAVSYLVRRLEENAQPQNFLHSIFDAGSDVRSLPNQEQAFRDALASMASTPEGPRRSPERPPAGSHFENTTDSDPSLLPVREWAEHWMATRAAQPKSPVLGPDDVDGVVERALAAQAEWGAFSGPDRAAALRAAADELEARRGELVAVAAAEGGKTIGEVDPEISEAIDFARYYGERAGELDHPAAMFCDGAAFEPDRVVLISPPWNFPVAIPAGGVLAALAAGSAVIIKPASPVPGCTEVAVEAILAALTAAGAPADIVQVVRSDRQVGRTLVSHPKIDTVVLTGSIETARMFKEWRAGRDRGSRVLAETSGKNSMIITPSADYDLAVADLVKSAFGHAGQKCSAASLVILVGSAGQSQRLLGQLVDAVESIRVGAANDLGTTMGPVIAPPEGKLLRALSDLDDGEEWLVKPRQLDDEGRLWRPGLKDGVAPGSFFHQVECFGPVLGIMRAKTLDEAIDLQNGTNFGLTGGLASLDPDEIDRWCERVEVGNAYVNRGTTGAIVRRQPFGGWKESSVGPGAKAGGPNYVAQLGTWHETGLPVKLAEPTPRVRKLLGDFHALLPDRADRVWLRTAAGSDAFAWQHRFDIPVDPSGLASETNTFRYRPLPELWVRGGAGTPLVEVLRLVLAATLTGTRLRLSIDPALRDQLLGVEAESDAADAVRQLISATDAVESDDEFAARAQAGEVRGRVRVLGVVDPATIGLLGTTDADLVVGPALANGRRELLSVLREQALSITRHRFGHLPPD